MANSVPLLSFRNVSLLRGGRRVLDRLTLDIGARENVAILGPNGSGKSSLVKLLTRELYPAAVGTPAEVRILGRDRWELFELRRRLGIVTADLQGEFARPIRALEAVLSGFYSSVGLWRNHPVTPARERRARAALARLGAAHLAGRFMDELSSGEARRVLIARALVHGPRALVLDEPAASLDLRAQRELRRALRRLARTGTHVVLVTHALEDLFPEIGRVVLLKDGRVFRDGPPGRILTEENLSALYGARVRVERENGTWRAF
jgi:iron complex transport system ATP-binding protein